MKMRNPITVFTKPWKTPDLDSLIKLILDLGVDGVELAVRPGYQIEPVRMETDLPMAAERFKAAGLRIESVAGELDRATIEACDKAGVPILRTMLPIDPAKGYFASVEAFQKTCHELAPVLEGSGVRVGVQNHCDNFVGTALGLLEALRPLPETFSAVLDFAHCSLCGEPAPYAFEIGTSRLAMVNLKNAIQTNRGRNEAGETKWKHRWVGSREGLTRWSEVVEVLRTGKYEGPICLTAEYRRSDGELANESEAIPLIREDIVHLKKLMG